MLWKVEDLQTLTELKQEEKLAFFLLLLKELGFVNTRVINTNIHNELCVCATIELGLISYTFIILFVFNTKMIYKNTLANIRKMANPLVRKGMIITVGTFSRDAKKHRFLRNEINIDIIDGNELTKKLNNINIIELNKFTHISLN